MTIVRVAVALTVSVLSLSACTSWVTSAACAAPSLVTTSGEPLFGEVSLHLWQPDGGSDTLDPGLTGRGAVLSPDGSTVAFTSPEGEYSDTFGYPKSRVALLSIETGKVTRVSSDIPDANVGYLHWSSDGSEVAFVRFMGAVREIVAVRVDDGSERRLLEVGDGQTGQFEWSSDGRELLVRMVPTTVVALPSASNPTEELWRYSIDTGDHVVIETPHSSITDLAWSPDGRFVGMSANIPDTTRQRLFVLDLESGISAPVDRRRGGPGSLTWSGPYLLYTYWLRAAGDPVHLMRWDSRSQERERVNRPNIEHVVGWAGTISAPSCGS